MRTLLRAALILLILLPLRAADLAQETDRIVRFYHEQYQFNGTVLVSKAGEVAFKGAYGMANRAVADTSPQEAQKLVEQSGQPEGLQSAGLWLALGDAFASKGQRGDAAKAYGSALRLAPGMAGLIQSKLQDLPK